jgi:PAS domain S-box-containing protein
MSELKRSPLFRYGIAILLVASASAITWLLQAEHTRVPFAFFFIAVVAATIYGGRGPGLVSIVVSAVLSSYFILPPRFSFAIGFEGLLQLGVFLLVAVIISYLAEHARLAEHNARLSEAGLRTTLQSIGDAVIATDPKGRVRFMNPAAERLTGWTIEDARVKELSEVFHIVNEHSRQRVESPVAKVLRDGEVVGLANHTMLIARDGREIPIDDSGAPIKDEDGNTTGVVLVFHDIAERRQGEEALLRLASIVESSDDAIFSKTLEGVITSWNRGAQKLYGYSAEEAIGRSVSMLVPPGRPDEVPQILEKLKAGEHIEHFETVRQKKNGERINVSLTISPTKTKAGEITGASTIAHNITERKLAEAEREALLELERRARIEAEEANRLKDEFLATLSHELRTPLTAMLGWTRMLRMNQLDERTSVHALETIERNVRAQTQLIEDLLDVSRIITGKLRLDTDPVELVPVIEAAIASIQPAAEAKEITIERVIDPTASPVLGDPARLQQVVWNLLANAVKFTPKGGRVTIALRSDESYVSINVTDTGMGISQDFLPYVFDRFRQADSSSTRAHGGLGLGLAIVRHLVELHGGTVGATSDGTQRGASFSVNLPVMTVNARRIKAAKTGGARAGGDGVFLECPPLLQGVRILIVDDEEDTRQLISTILEQCEAVIETAANTRQAIEAIRRAPPDVLISDIGMPDEDGYGLVRRLRADEDPLLKELPAVALTAYAGEDDRERALEAGFQIHLSKPADPQALLAAVEQLVKKEKS